MNVFKKARHRAAGRHFLQDMDERQALNTRSTRSRSCRPLLQGVDSSPANRKNDTDSAAQYTQGVSPASISTITCRDGINGCSASTEPASALNSLACPLPSGTAATSRLSLQCVAGIL